MNIFRRNEELFKLMIPILIELIFFNLLSFFDTFMISKYSQDSVIAIGNASSVIGIFSVMLGIASLGVNVVMSQFLGAGRVDDANKSISSGIIFNLGLALILFLLVELLGSVVLKLLRIDYRYLNEAVMYLKIVSVSIPFISLTNVFSAALRAYKKPHILMITSTMANLLNVILNYFLIFGIEGVIEPMGSFGAGIATLISHVFNSVISLICLKRIVRRRIFSIRIDKDNLMILLMIGLPSALESFCYTAANLIVMSAVNIIDTASPGVGASRSYLNQILGFVFQLSASFGNANQILVGHRIGQGNYKRALKGSYDALIICLPIVLFIILILNIFGRNIFNIFSPINEIDKAKFEVSLNEILRVLPVVFLLEIGRCTNLIFVTSLKASGDVSFPLVVGLISMFLVFSLGSYALGIYLKLGLLGIYIAQALDECIRGGLMIWRWQGKKWQIKSIIDKE